MRRAGYAAVCGAAVCWAVGGAYASSLIERGASFVELTQARAWITALVLALVMRRMGSGDGATRGPGPGFWVTVLFGLSIAAANLTYYGALSRLPVAIAITIQYTAPGLVVIWAVLIEGTRPSALVWSALVAAVAGVAFLAGVPSLLIEGQLRLDGVGLVIAGISAVAFATYMIAGERVARSLGAHQAVLRGFLVASALWIVVQAARGRPETLLDPVFIGPVIFLALATTVTPFLLFAWGLRRIGASEAGIASTLEPLTAAAIAFVWLGQGLSAWQVTGGVLVVTGIGLVQARRPAPEEVLAERGAVE